jgi:histidine triad (HIT) family protein
MECVFCRVVAGEIPADIVYQDEGLIAFRDLHPQAPTHILIIPKSHIASTNLYQAYEDRLMFQGHFPKELATITNPTLTML